MRPGRGNRGFLIYLGDQMGKIYQALKFPAFTRSCEINEAKILGEM
jgi:hypothetical protein